MAVPDAEDQSQAPPEAWTLLVAPFFLLFYAASSPIPARLAKIPKRPVKIPSPIAPRAGAARKDDGRGVCRQSSCRLPLGDHAPRVRQRHANISQFVIPTDS